MLRVVELRRCSNRVGNATMERKLVGPLLLILACCGCCACDCSCDYLPPVLGTPYVSRTARAGTDMRDHEGPAAEQGEMITPLQAAE